MSDDPHPRRTTGTTDNGTVGDTAQRRSSIRVRTTQTSALVEAHLRHPMLPEMLLKLPILDLSVSGCALLAADDIPAISPGIRIHGVQLMLNANTCIQTGLELQHITSIDHDSDNLRLGCGFTQMESGDADTLQRHIDQMQRATPPGRPRR